MEWGQRQMEEVAASSLTGSNVDLGLSWSPQGLLQAASSPRSSLLFLLQLINLPPRNAAEHRDNIAASGRQASLKSTSRRVAGRRFTGTHDWVREAAWGSERSGAMVPPHGLWGSVPEDLSGVGNEAQASSCCLVRPWLQLPPGGRGHGTKGFLCRVGGRHSSTVRPYLSQQQGTGSPLPREGI